MVPQIIHIQPAAPPKPQPGQACNGCGVCCLYEPCPLGRLLSRRRQGACMALRWDPAAAQYRCGALTQPQEILRLCLPPALRGLPALLGPVLRRLARRWIAVGQGCDCSLEVSAALPAPESDRQSAT